MSHDFKSVNRVGGIPLVVSAPLDAAITICKIANLPEPTPFHIHLVNAYTIALADKSAELESLLVSPMALNLPDGKPLSWISSLRRDSPSLQQIRGPKLFLDTFDQGRAYGVKHYLLGSTERVLESLQHELHAQFPGIRIVGSHSPPFRELTGTEQTEIDRKILDSGANLVWVGLGTPKQDFEVNRLVLSTGIPSVAVGAAFDFAAGTLAMSPLWVSNLGFEWVHRLLMEPRRLWRRYFFGNTRFLLRAIKTDLKLLRDAMQQR